MEKKLQEQLCIWGQYNRRYAKDKVLSLPNRPLKEDFQQSLLCGLMHFIVKVTNCTVTLKHIEIIKKNNLQGSVT